jgi:hypothetical protein
MQAHKFEGPAVIVQGGRSMRVACRYEVIDSGSGREWHGDFAEVGPGQEPDPGDAELHVGGGVTTVVIQSVRVGSGSGHFEGNGPPPPR